MLSSLKAIPVNTNIVGWAEGSLKNSNDETFITWFTICPNSNNDDNTFEICIAGHNSSEHRIYFDNIHE